MTVRDVADQSWDAVVVGAGPAGSVAARELARRGRRVLLVDRATFPRAKVCGCCLNAAALDTLSAIGLGSLVRQCGAVPLTRVKLAAVGRRAELPLPGGVALSREAFDAALAREAVAAGAYFLPGVAAKLETGRAGGVSPLILSLAQIGIRGLTPPVRLSRIHAQVIIAADGLNGQLTASEGNRPLVAEGSRIGAGVVAERGSPFYRPGTVFMAVGRGGYVGLVRLEDDRLDIAAAFDADFVRHSDGLGPAAAAVLRDAGLPAVPELEALPWRGTPTLTRTARRVAGPRWFAVGDAAGYVEPFTGEGMAWAVASAAAVAPIAARPWSESSAREWEATHARLIRSRQGVCRAVARVLRSPRLSRLAVRVLAVAPVLSRPVVGALNRPARAPKAFA